MGDLPTKEELDGLLESVSKLSVVLQNWANHEGTNRRIGVLELLRGKRSELRVQRHLDSLKGHAIMGLFAPGDYQYSEREESLDDAIELLDYKNGGTLLRKLLAVSRELIGRHKLVPSDLKQDLANAQGTIVRLNGELKKLHRELTSLARGSGQPTKYVKDVDSRSNVAHISDAEFGHTLCDRMLFGVLAAAPTLELLDEHTDKKHRVCMTCTKAEEEKRT